MKKWLSLFVSLLLFCSVPMGSVHAAEGAKSERDRKIEALLKASEHKIVYGPTTVELGNQARMAIRRGEAFVPPEVAHQIFTASGQKEIEGMMGIVVPGLPGDEMPTDNWGVVVLIHLPIGFVRDNDAKSWEYDKLLENIRTNFETSNQRSREQGLPEKEVNGWIEPPRYDASAHHLIWSTSIQDKGKPETASGMYHTAALGRDGILTFTFVTEQNKLSERKHLAQTMLSGIEFRQGKRYEDYAEGTDKVAEVGLAALIGGAAAKKLGLFAVLAALLAKWGKLIAGAVVGVGVFFKLWKKKGTPERPQ